MVSLAALWLPILLSAVFVFVVSAILHMAVPWHRDDYKKLPAEDEVMEALRRFDIPRGDYMVPCAGSPDVMRSPAFKEKFQRGPVLVMTVMGRSTMNMGPQLFQWFVYCLVVGLFAGYVASRAVGPGEPYLRVFRFAGAVAFVGYALALWQDTIWYRRSLGTTVRHTLDGLLFGLLTGGTFGWLWPR